MNSLDLLERRRNQLGVSFVNTAGLGLIVPGGTPWGVPSPVFGSTPSYNPSPSYSPSPQYSEYPSSPTTISGNGLTVFNNIASLVSQVVGAFGHNPTQQIITGNNAAGVGQGYSPAAQTQAQAELQQAIANQKNVTNAGNTTVPPGGGALEQLVASAGDFVSKYPIPIAIAVVLFLVWQHDPKKK